MNTNALIFDRKTLRCRRDRAAFAVEDALLFPEIADRLVDRLMDFTRTFPVALDLGAHSGFLADRLMGECGIQVIVQTDLSKKMLDETSGPRVVCDEEFLPFAPNVFDLVLSGGSLQWVNDLPGTLAQIHRILKPDGLFLALFPGGETLKELRGVLEAAELAATGGVSPRVSPFVDVRDAGALLQRTGFAMPVADSEKMNIVYAHPFNLLKDLQAIGETNVLVTRQKKFTRRSILFDAVTRYEQQHKRGKGVLATFELIAMTGWKA